MMEDMLPVLAAGAGGISKVFCGGRVVRAANHKYPFEYLNNPEKIKLNHEFIISRLAQGD